MSNQMSPVHLTDTKVPTTSISEDAKPHLSAVEHEEITPNSTEESKAQDPLLDYKPSASSVPNDQDLSSANSSPMKSSFSKVSIDEEKQHAEQTKKNKILEHKKRILDIAQRVISLILSIIILTVMSHAYVVFLHNKDVTHDGTRIYPTFMQLWPTYMMITAGAITVALNLVVVYWRIHGTIRDLSLIETSSKYWDYAIHGINFAVWLATSTSFKVTKNWGPAADPNVLWGYVCSPTANQLSASYPEIIRFYVQCEIQTVSFWVSVSAVIVEGFAVVTKLFVR